MDAAKLDAPSFAHPRFSPCCRPPCIANLGGPALACLIPSAGYYLGMRCVTIDKQWLNTLNKPKCMPSETAFSVVWLGAYTTIGVASYLVYKNGGGFSGPAKLPLMVYGGHLVTNWAWVPIFFGTKRMDYTLYDCVALDASAVLTAYLFYQIDQRAGLMFIPYLAWLGVETIINIIYYKRNPRGAKITEIKD